MKPEIKRDTVYLNQLNSIENATLIIDSTKKNVNLIYFSPKGGATIPISSILINENQLKFITMKKVTFFTMFYLALQTIGLAQPELNLKAGLTRFNDAGNSVIYGSQHNYGSENYYGLNQGIEIKTAIANSNFSFSLGFDFYGFGDDFHNKFIETDSTINEFDASSTVNQRALPILVYYRYKWVEAFVGYEYRFVTSVTTLSFTPDVIFNRHRNEHGISAGIELSLLKNLSITCKKYWGDPFGNDNNLVYSGSSIDFGIKYYLNRNKPSLLGK
jgi:hypothetical protein